MSAWNRSCNNLVFPIVIYVSETASQNKEKNKRWGKSLFQSLLTLWPCVLLPGNYFSTQDQVYLNGELLKSQKLLATLTFK